MENDMEKIMNRKIYYVIDKKSPDYEKVKKYKNSFEIVGASKNLMEWIRNVFANQYAITNNGLEICYTKDGTIMYKFAIRNKEKIKKIRDIFYKNPNCLCLERKKEKMYLL